MDIIKWTPSEALQTEFPEFGHIRVFGTSEYPLFPSKEVEAFLGMGQQKYVRDYKENKDYKKCDALSQDGKVREQILLTTRGLYTLMFKSKTEIAEKFKDFVTIVLDELRMHGQVTLNDVLDKLKKELNIEHDKCMTFQRSSDKYYMQKMDAQQRAAAAEMKLNQIRDAPDTSPEYTLELMKKVFLKRVYIHLAKPPKAIEDEFTDFEQFEPDDDDEICFEVSFRERESSACTEFFLTKDVKMETLHKELHDRDFTLTTDGKPHATKFRGTIDNIRELIDCMLSKSLVQLNK